MTRRQVTPSSFPIDGPKAEQPLAAVPLFDEIWSNALLAVFKQRLERMGGVLLEPPATGDALQPVRDRIAQAKVVCSMVPEIAGNREISDVNSPTELVDVQVVIARAAYVVAGTGSVFLSAGSQRVHAIARTARHLIVLLDPSDIVVNLDHTCHRAEGQLDHPGLFPSGASTTAQIEGFPIPAARGVRSLSVLPVAKRAHPALQYSKSQLKNGSSAQL